MKRPNENMNREARINEEVLADAYNEEERAMGWYYYAAGNLDFPFKARSLLKRATSPLKVGEIVEVIRTADEEDCGRELMVLIRWRGEPLAVPLAQLKPTEPTVMTRQVLGDWKYWLDRGYLF